MAARVAVLLIDDSPALRELTRLIIEQDDRCTLHEAKGVASSLELLEGVEVDVILLDNSLPEMDGLDAIPLLRAKAPGVGILLYTAHVFPGLEKQAMDRGAQGVVEKGVSGSELADAIRSAADVTAVDRRNRPR